MQYMQERGHIEYQAIHHTSHLHGLCKHLLCIVHFKTRGGAFDERQVAGSFFGAWGGIFGTHGTMNSSLCLCALSGASLVRLFEYVFRKWTRAFMLSVLVSKSLLCAKTRSSCTKTDRSFRFADSALTCTHLFALMCIPAGGTQHLDRY
jgi:hypothetical protein